MIVQKDRLSDIGGGCEKYVTHFIKSSSGKKNSREQKEWL